MLLTSPPLQYQLVAAKPLSFNTKKLLLFIYTVCISQGPVPWPGTKQHENLHRIALKGLCTRRIDPQISLLNLNDS